MKISNNLTVQKEWLLAGATLILVFCVLVAAAYLPFAEIDLAQILVILLIAALAGWSVKSITLLRQKNEELIETVKATQAANTDALSQLQDVVSINQELQNAGSEAQLIEMVVKTVRRLVKAAAVSYVPVDELGQSEAGFVNGDMPDGVLLAWAEHLASNGVRKQCRVCQSHQNEGEECPLLNGPFANAFRIYCLPLRSRSRQVGVLNIYLPLERTLDEQALGFIGAILQEMGVAIQSLRFQTQEQTTIKQLQLQRGLRQDFSRALEQMLGQVNQILGVEGGLVRVNELFGSTTPLEVCWGSLEGLPEGWIADNLEKIQEMLDPGVFYLNDLSIIAVSLGGDPELPSGFILFLAHSEPNLDRIKIKSLKLAAWYVLQMVLSQREISSIEFRAVIQERIRLAREIHDGLAQTLAFLKLQAAQMQGLINRGEMERLSQTLDQNYQTLSEAYLETRAVVDNLRLGPQFGLIRSLDKCITDFENGSGLKVERKLENLPWEIPVEIQAQIVRIVQEVFSNIRKHSRATQVWVGLRAWDEDLLLDIRDNGIGFSNELPELSQYGLRGMQERAEMIGADFQITSRPSLGTVVHLRLPSSILEMFL